MPDLSPLVNSGLVGITLASIILVGLFVRMFFKFMSNHMGENTKSNQELRDAIKELMRFLYRENGRK